MVENHRDSPARDRRPSRKNAKPRSATKLRLDRPKPAEPAKAIRATRSWSGRGPSEHGSEPPLARLAKSPPSKPLAQIAAFVAVAAVPIRRCSFNFFV